MTLRERFDAKWVIWPPTGCWVWLASRTTAGYGNILIGSSKDGSRSMEYAHRLSYEFHIGPILPGFQIDHLCRVRCCINPAHLELVTHAENVKRGDAGKATGAKQRQKTHCPRGHPYNLHAYYWNNERSCRVCKHEWDRRHR